MDKKCEACPRKCRAIRPNGFCHVSDEYVVSRAALHMYEEPPISGERGSGTIFFSGCNLGCIYCQNRDISRGKLGETVDDSRLERIIFDLEEQGAHNINLVTPSHYFHRLPRLLEKIKH
ncbi:MAG: 4Fe-4S cluster-binding domain-containing protein, partial [Clostridia bacterium]|nr:4Fe-4S cluster-binding domain-containing protein [Clostridia bacterium]